MPTLTENDIELRFERVGAEHTSAVPLVFGRTSQDSPKRHLPTPTDVIVGDTSNREGA